MIRTQIQLTETQARGLRGMSARRGAPMAELIRLSIDMFLLRESGSSRQALVKRAKDAVGTFSSGTNNVSTEHDDYLADAYSGR